MQKRGFKSPEAPVPAIPGKESGMEYENKSLQFKIYPLFITELPSEVRKVKKCRLSASILASFFSTNI